jgi:primosomal protein N' (replication factor Y)
MGESQVSAGPQRGTYGPGARIAVLVPLPLAGTYDYRVADGMEVGVGDFVEVPLGRRQIVGVVWGPGGGDVDAGRLRDLSARLPAPPLPEASRAFVEWVAAYTVHAPGSVLRMVMSVPSALMAPRLARVLALEAPAPEIRWTAARRRVVDLLIDGPPRPANELAQEAAVGPSVVAGLVHAGVLRAVELPPPSPDQPDPERFGVRLSPSQAEAAEILRTAVRGGFAVYVLDGVAGSGKTEVYFEAIAETLRLGRQALVLLPEIALGAQWLRRFSDRFGAAPAEWHSDLGVGERRRTWRAVAEGRARVVVGARSALFLPCPELGLIVVDEEHDPSFKQDDGVAYHARDMAVVRARLGQLPAILASATPSLETVVNAQTGRYRLLHLPDRHTRTPPPPVTVVDLRSDRPPTGRYLSPTLRAGLAEAFAKGSQALLFLNRRGYAPLTLCRACGFRVCCPNCTAWLVEHRMIGRLQCHHCGHSLKTPDRCPSCGQDDGLVGCGPGIERIAEEVAEQFPDARYAIATSDTLTGPAAAKLLVQRMEEHQIDLIIGTQIVAKGYHFPLLTLVGIVDADLGLSGGDLRAAERTFQLLSQVAGRAGRADRPGRAIVQTHLPEHPVIAALATGNREAFLAAEAAARQEAWLPPFGRMAALIVAGADEAAVDKAARALAGGAPRIEGVRVWGPAPAPLALLRGRHRRRLLLTAGRAVAVSAVVRRWLRSTPLPRSIHVQIDIDPYNFL